MPNDDFRGYLKKLVIHCPSSASKGTGMCRFYVRAAAQRCAIRPVGRDHRRDAESSGSYSSSWATGSRQFHAYQTMNTVVAISITLKKR